MSAALAGLCGVLLLAAARELLADHGDRLGSVLAAVKKATLDRLPSGRLLAARGGGDATERAGLPGLDPRLLALARVLCGLCAIPLALELAPVAPGHSGALLLAGLPVAAAMLPGLAMERIARARRARIEAALPDALELMAVAAASGVDQRALLARAAEAGEGALREELLATVAEIECGVPAVRALAALAERTGGDVAALTRVLERSRRLGSPLAAGLQDQAAGLRDRRLREITEGADRAAPKIQLVVALLLVPSVLLLVAAAILAHADLLLSGLGG